MIRDSDTDPSGKADWVVIYVSSDEGSSESDLDDDDDAVVIGEFDPKSKSRRMKVGCDDDECLVLDGDPDKPVLVRCDPDDDDDAVVIGEFDPKSKSRRMKVGCDDDECLVLDGDPDKPVLVRCDPCHDVQVVAEKGQIACRDYPHARHDCVKFPFRTTPHEKHCDLCHCYVCDSLAPCTSWGTGQLDQDHCHATDQDEDWKTRRKISILGKRIPAELRMQMNSLKIEGLYAGF